ncbi:tim-barrel domain-containing protein, partial [Dissophora ornata]
MFALTPDLVSASLTNIYDTFRISNGIDGSKIVIEGATMAGLGAGLNYYLREICQVDMAWSGDRFDVMPAIPPAVPQAEGVIRASFVPWRYYMNVVTFGYSFAFWDWNRWERELDWMFLNGINMSLAMVGQEYVFRQMYEKLGVNRDELNKFFSGPAHMPWQRMGNIQGSWGFPNDTQFKNDWIDSQWELQGHIMARMNDYNITAIMPSFNGFVPHQLTEKFPDVKFQNASDWGFIPDPYSRLTFISSSEPFFANITQTFLQTQTSLYQQKGLDSTAKSNNFYLLDLYNELSPICMKAECLEQATSGVMKALKNADPKAVWVMQSWFLLNTDLWKAEETKAFFDGIREVNQGKDAFVIDLYADVKPLWNSTEGFFGIDWGWSMLNNFGGGQGLYGTLPTLLTEPFKGYHQKSKVMRGMGVTMEGINNNEYMYQVVLDLPWESPPLDGQKHLESYIKRRYGPNQTSSTVIEAWTTLSQTVWDCRTNQMAQSRSYLDITPALDMYRPGFLSTKFWYNQPKVINAWSQLSELPLNVSSFRYDIVDVTREVMAAVVIPGLHKELVDAYKTKDLARTRSWGNMVLEAIKDTDRILATHSHFMLGPWIRDARISAKVTSASTSAVTDMGRYADYLEHSARSQITWWAPMGQQGLADYASKEWSGLVKGYYYPRWQIFVDRLVTAVQNGSSLDYKAYLEDSLRVEEQWIQRQTCLGNTAGCTSSGSGRRETFPLEPVEDTVLVAQDLWDRWNKVAARLAEKADK